MLLLHRFWWSRDTIFLEFSGDKNFLSFLLHCCKIALNNIGTSTRSSAVFFQHLYQTKKKKCLLALKNVPYLLHSLKEKKTTFVSLTACAYRPASCPGSVVTPCYPAVIPGSATAAVVSWSAVLAGSPSLWSANADQVLWWFPTCDWRSQAEVFQAWFSLGFDNPM